MPDSNSTVTQADIDVTNAILGSPTMRGAVQLAARHRQSSSNAGGVDVMREALAEICRPLGNEPETNHASLAKYWRDIAVSYRRKAAAALNPAQATPSALSGDAGEGE